MIDFRYHIVSLIAVFLALGVGVIVGTTVVDQATVAAVEANVEQLGTALREQRDVNEQLRADRARGDALAEQLGGWIVPQRLAGRPVFTIADSPAGRWRDPILQAFTAAGATVVGTLTLTDKFRLQDDAAAAQLAAITGPSANAAAPAGETAEEAAARRQEFALDALTRVGEALASPSARGLLARLIEAGYLTVEGAAPGPAWPPAGAVAVAFAAAGAADAPHAGWLAAVASATARSMPTVVVSPRSAALGAVGVLRARPDSIPTLSTFDAGESGYAGTAVVLSAVAAVQGRGGHFGVERGRRLVPPPA